MSLDNPEAFEDRIEAGLFLASKLYMYSSRPDTVVVGLTRGGVPVAAEVARELNLPLDVMVVRKLGVPGHEELAMGAIGPHNVRFLNRPIINELQVASHVIHSVEAREQAEMERREQLYRDGRPPLELQGKTVILVDDGLATGASMRAAILSARRAGASWVVVAVPVGSTAACDELRTEADEMVCGRMPDPFHAVGLWYHNFSQTSDEEIRDLLGRASHEHPVAR